MKINKQKLKKKSYTHKKIRILCHQGIYTVAENQEIYFRSRHRKHFYETGLLKVTNKTLESDHGGKQELEIKSFLQCIRKNTVLRHRTFLKNGPQHSVQSQQHGWETWHLLCTHHHCTHCLQEAQMVQHRDHSNSSMSVSWCNPRTHGAKRGKS